MSKKPHSQTQTGQQTIFKKFWQRKELRITAIVVACYIISLFLPFISPYTKYPLYVVRCGGLPIMASNAIGSRDYYLPGDKHYGVHFLVSNYFCSASEAKGALYNRYE